MKDSVKSSVVSKKPLSNLRQVKISSRQDRHSRVGVKSNLSCSNVAKPKNCLSWYVALKKPSEDKISRIPQIKWKCPPEFAWNSSWCVADGEGSQEAATQKLRETTVLEVVYPDLTSIPPSPFDSAHMEIECSDNAPTPIIPTIPIEELAALDTSTSDKVESLPENLPVSQSDPSRPQDQTALDKSLHNMLHGLEKTDLEVAVAAAATVAAIMEKKEQIDTELLIKFLTNPDMLKKLLDANSPASKPESKTPPAPDTNTSLPLPSPKSVPKHSEPVKNLPSPSSCLLPIGHLPVMEQVRPRIPYSSTSNEEIERLVKKYLPPDAARIMPVRPLYPSTSIPNREVCKKMIHQYGAAETMTGYGVGRGWGNAFVGPRLSLPAPSPLPPVTNHALGSNFTAPSNFHFSPVTTPAPNVGFNYAKSLIKQHGVMHEKGEQRPPIVGQPGNCLQGFGEGHNNMSSIVMNPKNQKPCAYFRSLNGCRDGYKCRYMHDGPRWRDNGAMEFPGSKRMKFTEQMGNWP